MLGGQTQPITPAHGLCILGNQLFVPMSLEP
jgi:hypothetical protein